MKPIRKPKIGTDSYKKNLTTEELTEAVKGNLKIGRLPESRFSWRKLEERALSLRGERVELEREKSLGEGVWRGFYTVAPASSHQSTSKSRFVLREVLKKKTALVSKDQVLCLLQEEEKEVKPESHFSWRKLEERALILRGERVELEREKSLGEGVWRGFYTVAPASSHRSTSKSRFVLREVLKKKTALMSKDQVLCLLQEEEKEVKVLYLTGLSVAPATNPLAKQKAFKPRLKQITVDSTIQNVNKSDVSCRKPNIWAFNISTKVSPLAKRKAPEPKLKSVIIDTANLKRNEAEAHDKTIFIPGRHDAEDSTSGVKLSRKAKRKANARLRASGWTNIPNPIQEPLPQPEANIPICNGFKPLRWVKRNNARGKLKKSFWETSYQPQSPPERKESASSCLHKLLKAMKNRKLMRIWSKLSNEGAIPTSRNPWKKEVSKRPHQGSNWGLPHFFNSKATEPRQCPGFERKPMGKSYDNLYHEG
ncbi:hypothetical protein M5K25_009063 [Dendrobium thyrsiflorum]|uniref:Uncharacterized protein n=1 Tax=Dendrobium thyrsiflorum TaxID=117978 RepID=A0ABD0V421_DENTH